MNFNDWLKTYKYHISPLNSAQIQAVEAYMREVKVQAPEETKVAPKMETKQVEQVVDNIKKAPLEELLKNKVVK